jgi:uncharacterized OB-fold protein/acyl dehydratase
MDSKQRAELEAKLKSFVGKEIAPPWVASDPVNAAMIRHYCAVVGDENPIYQDAEAAERSAHHGIVAPPTMIDAWTMPPYIPPWSRADGPPPDRRVELHRVLDGYGYTGVVATNQEQEYTRYLRLGELITARVVIDSISEEKATPLGLGYFITDQYTFRDQNGDEVGRMKFRVLKFKPQRQAQATTGGGEATPAKPRRLRPPMGHDNAWWWEGIARGELLIQQCSDCGTLRHPPRPMCGNCQSIKWEGTSAKGRGTVYSFTVLHHPKFPGFEYPLVCGLIELEEGTRIVSNVIECNPDDVHVGMPVELVIEHVDEEMKLPLFRPAP